MAGEKTAMLALTSQERRVILFLVFVALIGIGIDFLIKIYFPGKTIASFSQDLGKININTADKDLLMSVPGVGEKLALRIIEYRKQKGGFRSLEDLQDIKGITKNRHERIKGSFYVK
jgi:competence ComEA-like helix-hairpin-helix protein